MRSVVTIRQVAEEAGVSIQTVSRVVNNRYDVAAETRQRVQQAIERLGYQPNAIARGLVSRRSRTLGVVTYDLTDFFYTSVVAGAEEEAHNTGYVLMLGNSRRSVQEEPVYLHLLNERHVDGILFARESHTVGETHVITLANSGIPVVMTGFKNPLLNTVDIDNIAGGRGATECLIANDHRRIACITGPLSTLVAQERLQGCREALAAVGICDHDLLVAEGDFSHRSGYQAMQQILSRVDQQHLPFTAVFAHNDRMAIGAISALRQAGFKIPEDVSIAGYDDIPEAEFADPPLTTIRQPMISVGSEAIRLLVRHIDDPDLGPEQILLGTELVWRQSVRRIAG